MCARLGGRPFSGDGTVMRRMTRMSTPDRTFLPGSDLSTDLEELASRFVAPKACHMYMSPDCMPVTTPPS